MSAPSRGGRDKHICSPETRAGDLENVGSLLAAVEGADSLHYIPPNFNPREEEFWAKH